MSIMEEKMQSLMEQPQTEFEYDDPWQPIETAPKGSELGLGFVEDFGPEIDLWAGKSRYPNCCWSPHRKQFTMLVRYLTKKGHQKRSTMVIKNPTHWMPLPNPPEDT